MMKRILTVLLVFLLTFSLFTGCKDKKDKNDSYTIALSASEGGSLTADKEKVVAGESVTFSLTCGEGYVLHTFLVNGASVSPTETVVEGTYTYSWTLNAICFDVTAKAVFARPDVLVEFDNNGGSNDVDSMYVTLGKVLGPLPTPYRIGYRFLGWVDENGEAVNKGSFVTQAGTFTLKATWEEVPEAEKQGLTPYSITTTLYNQDATDYGVVWHSNQKPIASVMQVVQKPEGGDYVRNADGSINFENGRVIFCDSTEFATHYISTGVLDGLEFSTDYALRMGDVSGDSWSETYEFKTRAKTLDATRFLFVTDTAETTSLGNRGSNELIKDGTPQTYYQNVLKSAVDKFPQTNFIAHGGDLVHYGGEEVYLSQMLNSVQEYAFAYPTQITAGEREGNGQYSKGMDNLSVLYHYDAVNYQTQFGEFYSFNYGYVHFVSLKSSEVYAGGVNANKLSDSQLSWLNADLDNVDRKETPWVVVMLHDSPVSHRNTEMAGKIGAQLLPILTKFKVDLVLSGHNYSQASSFPLLWNKDLDAETTYDGNKLVCTTRTYSSEQYDGVTVDKFDFTGLENDKRGTVFHRNAAAGHQYGDAVSWANRLTYQGLAEGAVTYDRYRTVFGNAASTLSSAVAELGLREGAGYSMYSYIEATATQLVLRGYGVDCKGLVADTTGKEPSEFSVYFDGFMLNK